MAYSRRPGRSEVDSFIERCAGLDVHKASVKAYGRIPDGHGGRHSETRTFRTTTAGLVLLGDWRASHQIQVVGMESTGVYWKPVYYLLEDDVECWLLNAQHLKNVPGLWSAALPGLCFGGGCGRAMWSR
jgi:transposase